MVADMNTIRLKAVTGDFNTVDNVQKELEKSQYFSDVVISSANQSVQGDEVNFELKLELAR
jgi:outer membrane translocation and assembly module TamA